LLLKETKNAWGWDSGPDECGQKKRKPIPFVTSPTKSQIQNFPFFKIETRRLLEGLKSLEGLNISLVLSVGK